MGTELPITQPSLLEKLKNWGLRSILNLSVISVSASILVLIAVETGWAANRYIRAGATGNGGGTDWTNACTNFTGSCAISSLVRGDTYFVAAGTYSAGTFNTPESGTLVITIQRATTTSHGTDTGWSNAYDGQVTFSFGGPNQGIGISTSYWTFDGIIGNGNTPSNYGFLIAKPSSCSNNPQTYVSVPGRGDAGANVSNVILKHFATVACGPSFDVTQLAFSIGAGASVLTNLTIANNYISQAGNSFSITNLANSTIEQNWMENQWSSPSNHGEQVSVNQSSSGQPCAPSHCNDNVTFRFNIVKNCRGTACIAAIGPGDTISMNNWAIYGNVFVDGQGGNGVITTGNTSAFVIANTVVYNNTNVSSSSGRFFFQCGDTVCANATGNIVKNNLLYNSGTGIGVGTGGGSIDHDYNTFWQAQDTPPFEAHGQIVTLVSCPFVSCAIDNTGDYHLIQVGGTGATQVNVGLPLLSPFDTDMDGRTRGADGTWERGAFEFSTSSGGPSPPSSLTVF